MPVLGGLLLLWCESVYLCLRCTALGRGGVGVSFVGGVCVAGCRGVPSGGLAGSRADGSGGLRKTQQRHGRHTPSTPVHIRPHPVRTPWEPKSRTGSSTSTA
eukprot:357510-Chlamydomonas_euryale.AAC.2